MITVVSPTAFRVDEHAEAIRRTRAVLPIPSKGLLISNVKPSRAFGGEWAPITRDWIPRGEWNRAEYSRFMLQGLVDYVDTEFCITVQWDGYGVNKRNWDNRFLNYDYIGSPWPKNLNVGRVGNGGFSLRSRKWISHCANPLDSPDFYAPQVKASEDCYFCTAYREYYEKAGLRIAPLPLALKWGLEHRTEEYPRWEVNGCFGFHGFYVKCNMPYRISEWATVVIVYVHVVNDPKYISYANRFASCLRTLDPGWKYSLLVMFNGGRPSKAEMDLYRGIPGVRFGFHNNVGWDIGAFREAAKHCKEEIMVCMGSYTYAKRAGWLARLMAAWYLHGPGLYGPFGSYENRRHIRTTAFACSPSLINSFQGNTDTKEGRYAFEYGPNSLTMIAQQQGLPVYEVTWKANRGPCDWRKDEDIFRRGYQTNCILFDHHTDRFDCAPPKEREHLSAIADGNISHS